MRRSKRSTLFFTPLDSSPSLDLPFPYIISKWKREVKQWITADTEVTLR